MLAALVVTQHKPTFDIARTGLERLGVEALCVPSAEEAFGALLLTRAEAIVVDTLTTSPSDLQSVRSAVCAIPAIYLAAAANRWNPSALHLGQNDYVVARPIDSNSIANAVGLALNLSVPPAVARFEVAGLYVDVDANTLSGPNAVVSLTPTEMKLLRCLAYAGGEVVPAPEMMRTVWRIDPSTGSRDMVRAHIRNLRAKLKQASGAHAPLQTVHRRGYRLVSPSSR